MLVLIKNKWNSFFYYIEDNAYFYGNEQRIDVHYVIFMESHCKAPNAVAIPSNVLYNCGM